MTIAVCTNRHDKLIATLPALTEVKGIGDELLVVIDSDLDRSAFAMSRAAMRAGARVLHNGCNRGLAFSRNRVLEEAASRYVVFVDDDVLLGREVVEALRATFACDIAVAGTRIIGEFGSEIRRWYLTDGQLHYLGVHAPAEPAHIWGACMAVDAEAARRLGVRFDESLGRVGENLCSGEDTTFVRAIISGGGRHQMLNDMAVRHVIPPERMTFRYLSRRSFWQGRSEVRRHELWHGVHKEWKRNWSGSSPTPRKAILAALFTGTVAAGAIVELALPKPKCQVPLSDVADETFVGRAMR
jgi:glycosyltransferase involved in cell wall biosynthesis